MRQYQSGEELIDEIRNNWNKNLKSMRIWGVIASIFMIVIGAICFIYPIQTTYFVEVLASIAMLVFGIWEIVRYVQRPPFIRTGVSLASGIINIILAILLLTSPAEEMLLCFGFLFALDLLMLGFEEITFTGRLSAVGIAETGWLTGVGVLNIVIGILLLFLPFASAVAVSALLAAYLITGGITLLVISIKAKNLNA